jgi:hypothetical protein
MMVDDPQRWKDASDIPDDVRELLRASGRAPAMTAEDRAVILGAVGTGGLAAAKSKAAPTTVTSPTVLAGSAAVVAAGSILALWLATRAGPAAHHTAPSPPETATVAPPRDVPDDAAEVSRTTADDGGAPSTDVSPIPDTHPLPSAMTTAVGRRKPSSARANESQVDTLSAESVLISRARAATEASPGEALAALEEHARRFPRGVLAPERDYLAIKALHRLGRTAEARSRARDYAALHPSSPYVTAARSIASELEGR